MVTVCIASDVNPKFTEVGMNVIYEKDCPTEEQSLLWEIFGSYRNPLNTEHRFKGDGITDNRREYYHKKDMMLAEFSRQRRFSKENYQIDMLMGKIKICK